MGFKEFVTSNRSGMIFTAVVVLVVMAGYFLLSKPAGMEPNPGVLKTAEFKVAFTPEGQVKLFALARNNELAKLKAAEGNPIPEADSIVIGAKEAEMMREEKLFVNVSDTLSGLFGINTQVGGVLEKTDSPIDMLHFVSATQFGQLNATRGIVFARVSKENVTKMFFVYDAIAPAPFALQYDEISVYSFNTTVIDGKKYYPVVLGADEARMMREEKLFSKPGDRIDGFFGNDVFIAGVLKPTNSSIDMFHFVTKDAAYA